MYWIDDVTAFKVVTLNVPLTVRFWFNVGPTNEAVAAESCKPFI